MNTYFDEGRPLERNGVYKEFCSVTRPRSGPQYWYRAVSLEEYRQLTISGAFDRLDSYQGISTDETYVYNRHFGINMSHHLIEFKVDDGIDLLAEFRILGTGEKGEVDAMSTGIGRTATSTVAGSDNDGGEYFIHCLRAGSIRWRIVKFIGKKPPAVYRG